MAHLLPGVGGNRKAVTYQTTATDTTDAASYSFVAQAIGAAAADRYVHIAVHGFISTSIASVTIAGVTATANVQVSGGSGTTGIFTKLVTASTTADVAVAFNGTALGCHIGVWSSSGLTSATAVDTDTSTADPATATLTTADAGFCISAVTLNGVNTETWTNVTEKYDQTDAENRSSSGASIATTGANISPSGDFTSVSTNRSGVFATF